MLVLLEDSEERTFRLRRNLCPILVVKLHFRPCCLMNEFLPGIGSEWRLLRWGPAP